MSATYARSANGIAAGGGAIVISLAGYSAGELFWVSLEVYNQNGGTITPGGGLALVRRDEQTPAPDSWSKATYCKVLSAGDISTGSLTVTVPSTYTDYVYGAYTITGGETFLNGTTYGSFAQGATGTTVTGASIASAPAGVLLFLKTGWNSGLAGAPGGMTPREANYDAANYYADESISAGTTGTRTATNGISGDQWTVQMLVVGTVGVTTPDLSATSFPDSTRRSSLRTACNQAVAFVALVQALTPLPSEPYPERVARPRYQATEQQASAFVPLVAQTPTVLQAPAANPRRPAFPVSTQQAVANATALERRVAMACTVVVDRTVRPSLPPSQQLAATELPPSPERTTPLACSYFVDRVARAAPRQSLASALVPLVEVVPTWFASDFPDALSRDVVRAADQFASALVQLVVAQAPTQFAAYYPDAVARPFYPVARQQPLALTQTTGSYIAPSYEPTPRRSSFATAQQQALALVQLVEVAPVTPDLSDVDFPAAGGRPTFRAASQLAAALVQLVAAPVVPDLADAEFQATVGRPSFRVAHQQATALVQLIAPVAPALANAEFQAAVNRPTFRIANQLATALVQLSVTVPALADAEFPGAVARPSLRTANHLATTLVQLIEAPTWFTATFPASATRPRLQVASQLALAVGGNPEQLALFLSYPSTVSRPAYGVTQQAALGLLLTQPARVWDPSYPERITRPRYRAADQRALAFDPQPERTRAAVFVVAPDAAWRPKMLALHQQAVTGLSPSPIVPLLQISAADLPLFQAFVRRPTFLPHQQNNFSWSLSFPPNPPIPPPPPTDIDVVVFDELLNRVTLSSSLFVAVNRRG